MTLRKNKVLELERRSTKSHYVKSSLWNGLRTCRKADKEKKE